METELKFDLDPLAGPRLQERLSAVYGPPAEEQHLASTYFDTADKRLWKAGV